MVCVRRDHDTRHPAACPRKATNKAARPGCMYVFFFGPERVGGYQIGTSPPTLEATVYFPLQQGSPHVGGSVPEQCDRVMGGSRSNLWRL